MHTLQVSSHVKEDPPFGTFYPSMLVRYLFSICHQDSGPRKSRVLAPLLRKGVVKLCPLPVDVVAGGISLRCRFIDNYSEKKFVFTPWRYDLQERQLICAELPADGVFIDIGANVGLYSLTANRVLSESGRIIAFEPNPQTMRRLQFNLHANSRSPGEQCMQTLLQIGVSDTESTFSLQVDHANLGESSISPKNGSSPAKANANYESVEIQCRPLLMVLNELEVDHIDILKIDIEGAEDLALAPFLNEAPDRLLPNSIIIENSAHQWKCDLFKLMQDRGYHLRFRNEMNSVLSR